MTGRHAARAQYAAERIAARLCTYKVGRLPCLNREPLPHTHHAEASWAADRHDESEGSES